MKLHDYLQSDGALTVAQLSKALGLNTQDQVRQWQHGYANRRPGAAHSVAIEQATGGAVRRWDLRPTDWHRIWPELIGSDGAPQVPAADDEKQAA